MKLLLTSAGFTTTAIIDKCSQLVGKPRNLISFAVINEAYAVEADDKRWVLEDLNNIARNFEGTFDLVNLLALNRQEVMQRCMACDVIFVVGGHTDYLMHVFTVSGFADTLKNLLATKVYVGSSAGSMLLGKRVSAEAYQKVYGEKGTFGTTRYMEIVDFALKPHFDSPLFPNNHPEVLKEVCKGVVVPVYGLKDDSAVIIEGSSTTFLGTPPFIVQK